MNKQKILASVAAVLLTAASLAAVSHSFPSHITVAASTPAGITNLAPIEVRPSAADLKAAARLKNDQASVPASNAGQLIGQSVIGSQLVMPYYSFGNKFGRITKE